MITSHEFETGVRKWPWRNLMWSIVVQGSVPTTARLLRSWVRIPLGAWIFVCCECCDELITRPEESYRLCCVAVCDLETLVNEKAMAHVGLQRQKKKHYCSRTLLVTLGESIKSLKQDNESRKHRLLAYGAQETTATFGSTAVANGMSTGSSSVGK